MSLDLELTRTNEGVCPIVCVVLGHRGTGKTTLMASLADLMAPRDRLVIVSPIPALKARLPDVDWYKVSIRDRAGMEKLFASWMATRKQVHILADEGDELTGNVAQGLATNSVYDVLNYGRNYGIGATVSSRRVASIAKDLTANADLVLIARTTDPGGLDYMSDWLADSTEIDYQSIVRQLPQYVFLVWTPTATRKFRGYCIVENGVLREWRPAELRHPEPSPPMAGPSQKSQMASASSDTARSVEGSPPGSTA